MNDNNIQNCRFCHKEYDKTKITVNGKYGFCPHCHKVVPLTATRLKIEEDNTNKIKAFRPEFVKIYEVLIYATITGLMYLAAYYSKPGSLATSFLTIPYLVLAAGACPYIFARFYCHVHMYLHDVVKKIIPHDLIVSLAYLASLVIVLLFLYWLFVSQVPPIPLGLDLILFFVRNSFIVANIAYTLFSKLGTNPDTE